jgi:N-acetylmuramoyl-L-alanine amidase
MRKRIGILLYLYIAACLFSQGMPLLEITVEDFSNHARIYIGSSDPLSYSVEKNDQYLMIRIRSERSFRIRKNSIASDYVKSMGWTRGTGQYLLNIQMEQTDFYFDHSYTRDPSRLVIDAGWSDPDQWEKDPNRDGAANQQSSGGGESDSSSSSLPPARQGSLKTIVIDPGHGGLEVGARGRFGTLEKNVTLDIALKLKDVIERNLAYRVVMTRENDQDVSLDKRASIANNNQAYVFISIHANGFPRRSAHGSESYFLSLNATDEESRRIAYLENNSSEMEQIKGIDNEDDIKMILWDLAQSAYLQHSSNLAERIQEELNALLGTRNRGIKQAPFKVLAGVACPAVLVEVAFISNLEEEKKLVDDAFQMNVARAIYRGVVDFLNSYSGQ